jgi:3-deoxy-D-manno-octulosonic-acid transferase
LTASTATGQELARKIVKDAAVAWFPFDTLTAVRGFLERVAPRALVLIETELWPNVLRETRRTGAPVIVVNGRLSDRRLPRYTRFRPFIKPIFQQITHAGVQTPLYAERFAWMGVDPARIRVTGNTKFDAVATEMDAKLRGRLRLENFFPANAPILLFGSTRPGDEALAAACWKTLRDAFPALRLVVAPRHLARLADAIAPFDEPVFRRTEVKAGRAYGGERIFFLDTVGELSQFYALASVAVIGGSFYPGVNGHNPLEPAALGVATVFGPFMSNFQEPARALIAQRGAVQVAQPGALSGALAALIADSAERRHLGTLGRKVVLENRGAIARNVDLIAEALGSA